MVGIHHHPTIFGRGPGGDVSGWILLDKVEVGIRIPPIEEGKPAVSASYLDIQQPAQILGALTAVETDGGPLQWS